VVHGGFAPDLLPLPGGRALYGWVDGRFGIRWRLLRWEGMELSRVVSPLCPGGVRLVGPAPAYGSNQESAGP